MRTNSFERLAVIVTGISLALASASSAQTGQRQVTVRHQGKPVTATLLSAKELEQVAGSKQELIASTTRALQQRNSGGSRRGFHGAPALGTAVLSLSPSHAVDPNLRSLLSRGIFGEPGDGFMRFSTGNPNAKTVPEWVPDVRGIGIAVPNGNLSATNQPAQIVPRGIDFLNFFHGRLGPLGAPFRWGRLSPATALRGAGKLLIGTQPVPDLMRTRYWGYPTVVGADESGEGLLVARTVFTPVGEKVIGRSAVSRVAAGTATIVRNLFNPRFQSKKLAQRLLETGAEFEVGVQLYRDPQSTPLKLDGDKTWDVPVIPVATVTLPRQKLDLDLARAIEQDGSFGPQHTNNWETPRPDRIPNEAVGEFQTDRITSYAVSAAQRGAAPNGNAALLRRVMREMATSSR